MMDEKKALAMFDQGFHCSQIVLSAFADELEMDEEELLKISAPFGMGMNRGFTCGCLTGGLMAIGLKFGPFEPHTSKEEEDMDSRRTELFDRFKEKFGAITCNELLGGDMADPADVSRVSAEGKFVSHCPRFVAEACRILEDILED